MAAPETPAMDPARKVAIRLLGIAVYLLSVITYLPLWKNTSLSHTSRFPGSLRKAATLPNLRRRKNISVVFSIVLGPIVLSHTINHL